MIDLRDNPASRLNFDAIVLGAGIVGVCTALHLQERGLRVALVDKNEPGMGTSFGNAGLIERSSIIPYAFPREFSRLVRYVGNNRSDVHYHPSYLPKVLPWLFHYWRNSSPAGIARATSAMLPLIERCQIEHEHLATLAGMGGLFKQQGWVDTYRNSAALEQAINDAHALSPYGVRFCRLDRAALKQLEPNVSNVVVGGIHWLDPWAVSDPGALTMGYARLFSQRGGTLLKGDAATLMQEHEWSVSTSVGRIQAKDIVVALGADSAALLKPLGYAIPLGIKRGYHMHYAVEPGANLEHPIVDSESGYVLSPMTRGIRLATGVEFAHPDAPVDETQWLRAERLARELFPLGKRLDDKPWLGLRPCLPDMMPVIGKAPRHAGLWFNFGHAHHGLTLGPVTGRLLAECLVGESPLTDCTPYGANRFEPRSGSRGRRLHS